jgi:RHS repeat-associated protein
MLLDSAATVTDQYSYSAFGVPLSSSSSTTTAYRFAGERYDASTGLLDLRARQYHPRSGRFLTMDSYPGRVAEPLTLHKYAYAHNDPVNHTDPSGNTAIAGGYGQTLKKVSLAAIPAVFVTGLAVACVYRLTASYLSTALEIALLGGRFQFGADTPSCEVERKEVTCDDPPYSQYRRCSEISGRYNISGRANREGIELARIIVNNPTLRLFNPQPTNDGLDVCTGTPGARHWEVRNANGRGYFTSIKECTCCDEGNGKPQLETKCGFFGDHHPAFKDFWR